MQAGTPVRQPSAPAELRESAQKSRSNCACCLQPEFTVGCIRVIEMNQNKYYQRLEGLDSKK